MIIWQGIGFLVFVIAFGMLLISQVLTGYLSGDERYYQTHAWPKVAGMIVAAVLLSLVVRLRSRLSGRRLWDIEAEREVILHPDDGFMFVPLRWWPHLLFAAGIAFIFVPVEVPHADQASGPPEAAVVNDGAPHFEDSEAMADPR